MRKYENFISALNTLSEMRAIDKKDYDQIVYKFIKSGIINQYDKTFELSWKLMKEMLLADGFEAAKTGSPREVLKLAYSCGYFKDDQIWLQALKDRNNDSHIYDEDLVDKMLEKIGKYYLDMFEKFADFAGNKLQQ